MVMEKDPGLLIINCQGERPPKCLNIAHAKSILILPCTGCSLPHLFIDTLNLLCIHLWPDFSMFQFKTQYSTRLVTRTVVRTDNGSDLGTSIPPLSSLENGTGLLENVTRALGALQEVLSFEETVPVPGSANGINALGLVVFSVAFGLVIGGMKHKGRVLRDFFDSLNEAIMRLVGIIIW